MSTDMSPMNEAPTIATGGRGAPGRGEPRSPRRRSPARLPSEAVPGGSGNRLARRRSGRPRRSRGGAPTRSPARPRSGTPGWCRRRRRPPAGHQVQQQVGFDDTGRADDPAQELPLPGSSRCQTFRAADSEAACAAKSSEESSTSSCTSTSKCVAAYSASATTSASVAVHSRLVGSAIHIRCTSVPRLIVSARASCRAPAIRGRVRRVRRVRSAGTRASPRPRAGSRSSRVC